MHLPRGKIRQLRADGMVAGSDEQGDIIAIHAAHEAVARVRAPVPLGKVFVASVEALALAVLGGDRGHGAQVGARSQVPLKGQYVRRRDEWLLRGPVRRLVDALHAHRLRVLLAEDHKIVTPAARGRQAVVQARRVPATFRAFKVHLHAELVLVDVVPESLGADQWVEGWVRLKQPARRAPDDEVLAKHGILRVWSLLHLEAVLMGVRMLAE
mmetsp:Transcript_64847/g.187983  ORF Transcript_64847/g.187983 Transcript_64847/m.187983 type:complete len:212 (-) Transcript_64847:384-1019(-)